MKFTSTTSIALSYAAQLKARLAQLEGEYLNNMASAEIARIAGNQAQEAAYLSNMQDIDTAHEAVLAKVTDIEKANAGEIAGTSYEPVQVLDAESASVIKENLDRLEELKSSETSVVE